jgi:hypothetical protein
VMIAARTAKTKNRGQKRPHADARRRVRTAEDDAATNRAW